MRDGVPCHLVSAAIAGVTATVVASPVSLLTLVTSPPPLHQARLLVVLGLVLGLVRLGLVVIVLIFSGEGRAGV